MKSINKSEQMFLGRLWFLFIKIQNYLFRMENTPWVVSHTKIWFEKVLQITVHLYKEALN